MRSYVVFSVLLAMLAALAFVLVVRPRTPHAVVAPVIVAPEPARGDASVLARGSDGGARVAVGDGGRAAVARGDASVASRADASVAPRLDRPLRVVGLGWELLAPGVVANRGAMPGRGSAFGADGLTVHFASTDDPSRIESALARGGADPHGADVAVLPLPTFVASYERLRALAPEVFFVVGWSRGGQAIGSTADHSLTAPLPPGDVTVNGAAGSAAAYVALFALDQAGVPGDRLQLVGARPPDAFGASSSSGWFIALDRTRPADPSRPEPRRLLLTTAEASRLVPYVAVVPEDFARAHAPALQAWARAWLAGAAQLAADVPAAAREIADVDGAPDALALLQRLGMIEPASLGDNARAAGLAGRGAVTLEALFQNAWRLWRSVGVLTTPPPENAPLATGTIAALVRADPTLARAESPATPPVAAPPVATPVPAGAPLLVRREPAAHADDATLVADVGLLAGVFERSAVRVAVRNDAARTRAVLANARERFDVPPARLIAGTRPTGGAASIEVLSVQ